MKLRPITYASYIWRKSTGQTMNYIFVVIGMFQCSTCEFVCILPPSIQSYIRVVPPRQKPVTNNTFMFNNTGQNPLPKILKIMVVKHVLLHCTFW